ncbi:hypothetical protein J6590_087369 [Homalodisca vitripennis]|nr:hypothetical protein J6590_087369 [Homalodisca vitripennis]
MSRVRFAEQSVLPDLLYRHTAAPATVHSVSDSVGSILHGLDHFLSVKHWYMMERQRLSPNELDQELEPSDLVRGLSTRGGCCGVSVRQIGQNALFSKSLDGVKVGDWCCADIGGGAESMRGNDCRWLGAAWRCSVLHAVLVFDGRVELPTLQQLLLSRVLPAYPRLTHRLHKLPLTAGAGHCWLPDPHFDIDKHVFHGPCLPTDLQLQTYVSELLSEGLLTDKPPWELQVLHAAGRQGTTTILRVHQSVADGPALVTMLCRCLADTKVMPRIPVRPHNFWQ